MRMTHEFLPLKTSSSVLFLIITDTKVSTEKPQKKNEPEKTRKYQKARLQIWIRGLVSKGFSSNSHVFVSRFRS